MKLKVLLLIAQDFFRRKSVTNVKRIFLDTTWNGKGFKHVAYFGTWQPRRVLNFHSVSAQIEQPYAIAERSS